MKFFRTLIAELVNTGIEVDIACNVGEQSVLSFYSNLGCNIFQVDFSRNPVSLENVKATKQLMAIIDQGGYNIVHCHTPVAGVCTRLACRKRRKNGLRVIYTAHGFHFYKGAPVKNWIVYYPIEKLCAHWTDTLITINKEDYALAKKKMRSDRIEYVPGVGIDSNSFSHTVINRDVKRNEIGVPPNAKMLLSVGELNVNKNHQAVVEAISKINNSNIHYVIAGIGDQEENLAHLADELDVNLHLLGYRNDVAELYRIADLYVLPSFREGLNVSVMEALASGCPTIVSRIRGNVDMVPSENTFNPNDINALAELIERDKIINGDFVKQVDYSKINQKMRQIMGI